MTALALGVCLAWLAAPQAAVPELLVGVAYSAPANVPDAVIAADLRAMRRAGYNILVVVDPRSRDRLGEAAIAERLPIIDGVPADTVRITVGSGARGVADARLEFWTAIARGARSVVFESPGSRFTQELRALGESAGIVTRNQALFMPMRPRSAGVKSVTGEQRESVDIHLMESPDALVIVGINRATVPSRVTVAFDAAIPEAMWQNMESGTSIDFVMRTEGPVFDYTFAPRDALVLMIRKRFR